MVKYYGRAKQKTGSLNTNQTAFNLGGLGGGVGRRHSKYKKRAGSNVKVCGPVHYQGQIWSVNTKQNSICIPPSKTCSSAGGVGRINAPRFSCSKSDGQQGRDNDIRPPVFTSSDTFTVEENETFIGNVTATDPEGNPVTFTISGDVIEITPDGVLTFKTPPDFEFKTNFKTRVVVNNETTKVYKATVTASDGTNTSTQDITVNVTNVNDNAPVFTSSATFSARDGQSTSTPIGQVTATDADGNSATFTVSGSELAITLAGELTFTSPPIYSTQNIYTATVTASDGMQTTTQDITINVTRTWIETGNGVSFNIDGVEYGFTYETTIPDGGNWGGPYNNEQQEYDDQHARVNDNGELEIFLTKENTTTGIHHSSGTYNNSGRFIYKSSRLVMSDEKEALKLEKGKQISIEFEGKMPTALDSEGNPLVNPFPLWPAFWMMGTGVWKEGDDEVPWPRCAEVDVLEWYPKTIGEPNIYKKYSNAIHWENGNNYFESLKIEGTDDLRNNFHKYKTIISRDSCDIVTIKMYFDGVLTNQYDINNETQNEFYQVINSETDILDYKYYGLLMNIALGGTLGGSLDDGEGGTDADFSLDSNGAAVLTIRSIAIEKSDAPQNVNFGIFADSGATRTNDVYEFPNDAEDWAGFANTNTDLYPLTFPNGGSISFKGSAVEDTDIKFKFEKLPYDESDDTDTEPSFNTDTITISGEEEKTYTVNIESQAANTFSSFLLYIIDRDKPVTLKDFCVVITPPSNNVTVETSENWKGYINAYNTDGSYADGFTYPANDLQAIARRLTASPSMTLKPNVKIWSAEQNNAKWFTNGEPNKNIEANSYIENDSLAGSDLTFSGNVSSLTDMDGYTVVAFIKALNPNSGYSTVTNNTVGLDTTGNFTVSATAAELASGHIIQYGFAVTGPLKESTNDSVVIEQQAPDFLVGDWKIEGGPGGPTGTMGVGPSAGDISWWRNDIDVNIERACFFDDIYHFDADGTFKNKFGSDGTWLEWWQSPSLGPRCGQPIYPHDGSEEATWEYNSTNKTITLIGKGSYLGLPKVYNGEEITDPNVVLPDKITYNIFESTATTMTIQIQIANGWWQFKFTKENNDVLGGGLSVR